MVLYGAYLYLSRIHKLQRRLVMTHPLHLLLHFSSGWNLCNVCIISEGLNKSLSPAARPVESGTFAHKIIWIGFTEGMVDPKTYGKYHMVDLIPESIPQIRGHRQFPSSTQRSGHVRCSTQCIFPPYSPPYSLRIPSL
ncbi:hypothetical protein CDAR_74631 [Caerostris darwini]|uniref:Uncharacterized protein n=1 Tax=Caerostris darwini TaxID=1538125 RepID=A0AAV4P076_9ARAC|nr:hypothetical protein CDAR_74631 [Caerostris darwini]